MKKIGIWMAVAIILSLILFNVNEICAAEEEAIDKYIQQLRQKDYEIRTQAEQALRNIGKPAVEPLIHELAQGNLYSIKHAMSILGSLRDTRALKPLLEVLTTSDDGGVRMAASWALGRMGAAAVKPLIEIYENEELHIDARMNAVSSLYDIGLPTVESQIKLLRSQGIVGENWGQETLHKLITGGFGKDELDDLEWAVKKPVGASYKELIAEKEFREAQRKYYQTGELEQVYATKNGKIDGFSITYYKNGKIKSKIPYKDGKIEGIVEEYYENGKPRTRKEYRNNLQWGFAEDYDETGKMIKKAHYYQGELVSEKVIKANK